MALNSYAGDYRYGFQGQETDDEIFGEGNARRVFDEKTGQNVSGNGAIRTDMHLNEELMSISEALEKR